MRPPEFPALQGLFRRKSKASEIVLPPASARIHDQPRVPAGVCFDKTITGLLLAGARYTMLAKLSGGTGYGKNKADRSQTRRTR